MKWNLGDLYSSQTDPRIMGDLQSLMRRAQAFSSKYRGKLARVSSPQFFSRVIGEYDSLLMEADKPLIYAELFHYESSHDPARGALLERVRKARTTISRLLTFFDLEIVRVPDSTRRVLLSSPSLRAYRHYLTEQFKWKRYQLTEPEEKLLAETSLTGSQAFGRLFDQEFALKKFCMKRGGRTVLFSEAEILELMRDEDRSVRKEASHVFSEGLKEDLRRITFIYNTLAESHLASDARRGFASPDASRHLSNGLTPAVVECMVEVVQTYYPLLQEFYRFKRKVLNVGSLTHYDRYVSFAPLRTSFSFSEARRIVCGAFKKFSIPYAQAAEEFFSKRWIDAASREGKYGSAFCMPGTPDSHPYILLNFKENVDQVRVLAHELGHGVQYALKRGQSYLEFGVPLTLAETSSVFAELLFFDSFYPQITDRKQKLGFLMTRIEDMFATVFRQISMYLFERDFYEARRKGELSPEDVNRLWRARQAEMFKDSLTLLPEYDMWWAYVSHFMHSPFYVYAYAFGELLTLSFYAMYKREGGAFSECYLRFLTRAGGESPIELLRDFGINPASRDFWKGGMELLKGMVQEAKSIS